MKDFTDIEVAIDIDELELDSYKINQVEEILNKQLSGKIKVDRQKIRYASDKVGLDIARDNSVNQDRIYSKRDIEVLKTVFLLREENISYDLIRKMLEDKKIISPSQDSQESGLVVRDDNKGVEEVLKGVESSFKEALVSFKQELREEIREEIKEELAAQIEQQNQRIEKLLEENNRKTDQLLRQATEKKSWLQKIFG